MNDQPQQFTAAEKLACARREIAMRKQVYGQRGMLDHHQRELALMEQIGRDYEALIAAEPTPLFAAAPPKPSDGIKVVPARPEDLLEGLPDADSLDALASIFEKPRRGEPGNITAMTQQAVACIRACAAIRRLLPPTPTEKKP